MKTKFKITDIAMIKSFKEYFLDKISSHKYDDYLMQVIPFRTNSDCSELGELGEEYEDFTYVDDDIKLLLKNPILFKVIKNSGGCEIFLAVDEISFDSNNKIPAPEKIDIGVFGTIHLEEESRVRLKEFILNPYHRFKDTMHNDTEFTFTFKVSNCIGFMLDKPNNSVNIKLDDFNYVLENFVIIFEEPIVLECERLFSGYIIIIKPTHIRYQLIPEKEVTCRDYQPTDKLDTSSTPLDEDKTEPMPDDEIVTYDVVIDKSTENIVRTKELIDKLNDISKQLVGISKKDTNETPKPIIDKNDSVLDVLNVTTTVMSKKIDEIEFLLNTINSYIKK